MKELMRSTDPTMIAFATAMLQGEDIATFPLDVHMSVLEGSSGFLPRRLMVLERDLWRARIVLADNNIPTGL
jgi:Putative prokaryotic signal transducing protein